MVKSYRDVILREETLLEKIISTPWDTKAFGMDTFEVRVVNDETLRECLEIKGHYTVKADPLSYKELLMKYGFYYCDTLLEPYCAQERFCHYDNELISVSREYNFNELLSMCRGAFRHDRFHRDPFISKEMADTRYQNWLSDLHRAKTLFALRYANAVAGFWGYSGAKAVLHALSPAYQERGLAKFFWSAAFQVLFAEGNKEVTSSISAGNVSILNVYSSLGFRFRNPVDVYHKLVI